MSEPDEETLTRAKEMIDKTSKEIAEYLLTHTIKPTVESFVFEDLQELLK